MPKQITKKQKKSGKDPVTREILQEELNKGLGIVRSEFKEDLKTGLNKVRSEFKKDLQEHSGHFDKALQEQNDRFDSALKNQEYHFNNALQEQSDDLITRIYDHFVTREEFWAFRQEVATKTDLQKVYSILESLVTTQNNILAEIGAFNLRYGRQEDQLGNHEKRISVLEKTV